MTKPGGRKRGRKAAKTSESSPNTSASDTSRLSATPTTPKRSKLANLTVSTPTSVRETLKQFAFVDRPEAMAAKGDDHPLDGSIEVEHEVVSHPNSVSNAELMRKLDVVLSEIGANGARLVKLTDTVEELRSKVFQLEQENDSLRTELAKAKERETDLFQKCDNAFLLAQLADRKSEDTAAYYRRNNLRVYGVEEKANESQEACEQAVLDLFNKKLQVKVQQGDIEAVHRLGRRQQRDTPRGIIVRFVSRRIRDQVIYSRRTLRGTRLVIAEDLTPRAYALLMAVRDDRDVCQQAWTRNGRVFMKSHSGEVAPIDDLHGLRGDQGRRRRWAGQSSQGSRERTRREDLSRQQRHADSGRAGLRDSSRESRDSHMSAMDVIPETQVAVGASGSGADTAGVPPGRSPHQQGSRATASSQRSMSELSVLELFSQVRQKP